MKGPDATPSAAAGRSSAPAVPKDGTPVADRRRAGAEPGVVQGPAAGPRAGAEPGVVQGPAAGLRARALPATVDKAGAVAPASLPPALETRLEAMEQALLDIRDALQTTRAAAPETMEQALLDIRDALQTTRAAAPETMEQAPLHIRDALQTTRATAPIDWSELILISENPRSGQPMPRAEQPAASHGVADKPAAPVQAVPEPSGSGASADRESQLPQDDARRAALETAAVEKAVAGLTQALERAIPACLEKLAREDRAVRARRLDALLDDLPELFDKVNQELAGWEKGELFEDDEQRARGVVVEVLKTIKKRMQTWQKDHSIERVPPDDPAGQPFDEALHERIKTATTDDSEKHSQISEVVDLGYLWRGERLRKARVIVWGPPPQPHPPITGGAERGLEPGGGNGDA